MTDTAPTLRLGTVPYLNARPLVAELDHPLAGGPPVTLVQDVPSRLARRLRAGELDAALVSAVELFRDPPLGWLAGPAIVSRGPVASILLFHERTPDALRRVGLDTASLSAAAMTRVCLAEFLGAPEVEFVDAPSDAPLDAIEADAVLRIGDAALATDPGHRQVLDLGEVWTRSTGLPFVYALWLTRADLPAEPLGAVVTAAAERGVARRFELARLFARMHQRDPRECVEYLRHHIGYEFGDDERAGLERFGALAHAHGLVDRAELPPALVCDRP